MADIVLPHNIREGIFFALCMTQREKCFFLMIWCSTYKNASTVATDFISVTVCDIHAYVFIFLFL